MREDYDEREELKWINLPLSGDVSCDSMVVNKPPDEVSATRSGLLLHTATVKDKSRRPRPLLRILQNLLRRQ